MGNQAQSLEAAVRGQAKWLGGDGMDAKTYLSQLKKVDAQIRNKLIEKQQWKDIALGITSNTDGERVQSSGRKSKMADAVDKVVDVEAEIDSLVDKLIDTKKEVIQTIEQLESALQYDVVHACYIQNLSYQEIADKYGKSYDWVKQAHKRAIRNVQMILDGRRL